MDAGRQVQRHGPRPLRWAVAGTIILGVVGGVVGLVVGLNTYAPTAWAATAELGLPAAILGALVGGMAGWLVQVVHRAGHWRTRDGGATRRT